MAKAATRADTGPVVEPTIEELRAKLARQILNAAIDNDNPQFKLDAFKATEPRGKLAPSAGAPAGAMSLFQNRVKQAEEGGNGEDAEPAEDDS